MCKFLNVKNVENHKKQKMEDEINFGQETLTKKLFCLANYGIIGVFSGGKKDNCCSVSDYFIYFIHVIHTSS